jgi:hypothetical protein
LPSDAQQSPPIPLTLSQLDEVRAVLQKLVKGRSATYQQMAEQLGVDTETLKSFCRRRSLRPRGDFLRKLTSNLRRLAPFAQSDENLKYSFTRLIMDLSGTEYNKGWHEGFYNTFGITRVEVAAASDKVAGEYLMYRNAGNSLQINKTSLKIEEYDENSGVQRILVTRKIIGPRNRVSEGFIMPLHDKYAIFAKIGVDEGMFSIFAERDDIEKHMFGIMTTLHKGELVFSTRIFIFRTTAENQQLQKSIGLISQTQLQAEISGYHSCLNNSLDHWATMQVIK